MFCWASLILLMMTLLFLGKVERLLQSLRCFHSQTPVTATVVVGKDPTFDVDVHVMAKQVKLLYDSERQCVCGVARDGVTQFAEVDKKDSVNHPEVFPWGPPNRIQRAH